jgi:hypothetical protein
MHCLLCGQKLGLLKSVWDSDFCSQEHKRLYGTHSSRVLREKEDVFAYHERWCDDRTVKTKEADPSFRGIGVFAALVLVLGAATFVAVPAYHPQQTMSLLPDSHPSQASGLRSQFSPIITRLFGNSAAVDVQNNRPVNFQKMWTDLRPGTDWSYNSDRVRPGRLRIWTPSTALSNYDFEFVGQIERKSMNYAFRAANARNYYATKLTLAGSGSSPQSELIRYIVLDGKALERIQLPIPVSLSKNTDYRVHLTVRGSEFLTSIDGQVVSAWRDRRIRKGGVGFFSEDGEMSSLKWASLSERDSFVGRMLSHFSILTLPATLSEPGLVEY